jgi:hypothetical protein
MTVLALIPETDRERIPLIQSACRERKIPLAGAIFPELLGDAGFIDTGAWLLRLPDAPPTFLIADLPTGGPAAAGQIVTRIEPLLHHTEDGLPVLFMIFDAMRPDIGTILTSLFTRLKHRVEFAGVNAGSESFTPMPCLFDADRLIGNGVLLLLLPKEARTVVKHGYPVSRALMRATSTEGNRIDKIDGRPAFEVYREVVRAEYGVELTHENFYDLAVHFPFGVITAIDVLVRIPVAFNEDGSLVCIGEVAPNAFINLLRAPSLDKSDCVAEIGRAFATPDNSPLLAFYCAGRRLHFGREGATQEIAQLKASTGARPVVGALSLGEIDTQKTLGFPRFHNATLVCVR